MSYTNLSIVFLKVSQKILESIVYEIYSTNDDKIFK